MADKIKEWQSSIVWVIITVFACGMTYTNVLGLESKVSINVRDIKDNTDAIHREEVQRMAMQGEISSTNKTVGKIEKNQEKLMEYLMQWEFNESKGLSDGKKTSNKKTEEKGYEKT